MNYYLYAETAFHHEGDEAYLRALIEGIAETGAQGVKFQVLIDVDAFVSSRHRAYASIRKWVFTLDQWRGFFQLALDKGLEIVAMPLDAGACRLVEEFPVAYLELHSVSFHDPLVLKKLKEARRPVILGVGGRTLQEVGEKVEFFSDRAPVLMTGFQAFPSDLRDVRLPRIAYFRDRFPESSIGYADHTAPDNSYGLTSLEYAYLLGARIFEKHVTLHEGVQRVDYEAAVGLDKLADIKKRLDYLQSLTAPSFKELLEMSPAEIRYRARQKFAVARRQLEAGHLLKTEDLCLKITDEGQGFAMLEVLIGRRLNRRICPDEVVVEDALA